MWASAHVSVSDGISALSSFLFLAFLFAGFVFQQRVRACLQMADVQPITLLSLWSTLLRLFAATPRRVGTSAAIVIFNQAGDYIFLVVFAAPS